MFNWLKRKDEIDAEFLPKPSRPAETMPEIMPYHEGEVIISRPDISEPVITLLEMLKRDEWEVVSSYVTCTTMYRLTNVYKESVSFSVFQRLSGGLFAADSGQERFAVQLDWLTADERKVVEKAVMAVITGENTLAARHGDELSRYRFAKLINVEAV